MDSLIPEQGNNELSQLASHCNGVINSLNQLILQLQGETGILNQTGNELSTKMSNHIQVLSSATCDITTNDITSASAHMKGESENVFEGIRALNNLAESTMNKSSNVSVRIDEMRNTAEAVVAASDTNLTATSKVADMINGFSTSH